MWAEALDLMMDRLSRSGLDMGRLAAIQGSAQQRGSVHLNEQAAGRLALDWRDRGDHPYDGGAAVNPQILRVMADVFGAEGACPRPRRRSLICAGAFPGDWAR